MSSSPGRGRADDSIVRAALAYAAHGWAVFPVHGSVAGGCDCGAPDCSSPGKHPLTRRGLKDATTDTGVVAGWWKRWPAANLALATGSASGVVVIDVDLPQGDHSLAKLLEAGYELPDTLTVRTGSGGLHLYYAEPEVSLGNSAGRLPGAELQLPGVDLRGEGGYVVAPPSLHVSGSSYQWIDGDAGLAPAPAWLRPHEEVRISEPPRAGMVAPGSSTPYGLAALIGELEELRIAPEGTRNHTLNRCAFRLGRLVAGGELNEPEVIDALRARALSRGLTRREIERTISSGLAAGQRQARSRPRN
jgi:Bifunctional DNA primase/polymerase, N-terminal